MRALSHDAGGTEESFSNVVGIPNKYTRLGARYATKAWLSSVTGTGSRRASMRSTVPPSSEDSIGAAASSHSHSTTASHTLARSRGNTISATSPSDVENSRGDYTRNTSIRRNLLECTQRCSDRSARCVTRDPLWRTTQTFIISTASAYSGSYAGDSLSSSAVPSSAANTEWEPGSGFRIIVEDNTAPRPPTTTTATDSSSASGSVSGFSGRTSAWDSGKVLRQAVNTHPGEHWLAWARSWVSNPPYRGPNATQQRTSKGAEVLFLAPLQVTPSP